MAVGRKVRRRANDGRGTIHRALRCGGRGKATPLPLAALRRPDSDGHILGRSRPSRDARPYLETETINSKGNRKPEEQRSTGNRRPEDWLGHTFPGPRSRPSGIWCGYSGTGTGPGPDTRTCACTRTCCRDLKPERSVFLTQRVTGDRERCFGYKPQLTFRFPVSLWDLD